MNRGIEGQMRCEQRGIGRTTEEEIVLEQSRVEQSRVEYDRIEDDRIEYDRIEQSRVEMGIEIRTERNIEESRDVGRSRGID